MGNYFSAEELLYDVEKMFVKTNSYFPPEARDIIRERMQYQQVYREMQKREAEQQQISEFIGSGNIPQSISDQIVDDLNKPEIMGIDFSQYATTKESIIPPDIQKFADRNPSFFRRVTSKFVGWWKRKR